MWSPHKNGLKKLILSKKRNILLENYIYYIKLYIYLKNYILQN